MIPEEMKNIPNWVLWKSNKEPYSVMTGGRASSTNPGTWVSYERAVRAWTEDYAGVGFVFTLAAGIIFIDIDHCICDSVMDERARDILGAFKGDVYYEVSQSGTGLHIFVKGTIPRSFKNSRNGVEMYSQGRYCAVTGNGSGALVSDQAAIDYIFNKYKTPERKIREHEVIDPLSLTDADVIDKACRNEKFAALWAGDDSMYQSRSEADAALCVKLAFWSDCKPERIDILFRSSGLYRDKWDRNDYRDRTIKGACACCEESYSEYVKRKKREEASRIEGYARGL